MWEFPGLSNWESQGISSDHEFFVDSCVCVGGLNNLGAWAHTRYRCSFFYYEAWSPYMLSLSWRHTSSTFFLKVLMLAMSCLGICVIAIDMAIDLFEKLITKPITWLLMTAWYCNWLLRGWLKVNYNGSQLAFDLVVGCKQ